jgi:hypothetical protein
MADKRADELNPLATVVPTTHDMLVRVGTETQRASIASFLASAALAGTGLIRTVGGTGNLTFSIDTQDPATLAALSTISFSTTMLGVDTGEMKLVDVQLLANKARETQTVDITAATNLTSTHHGRTLLVKSNQTLQGMLALADGFSCRIVHDGGVGTVSVEAGVTLVAPAGAATAASRGSSINVMKLTIASVPTLFVLGVPGTAVAGMNIAVVGTTISSVGTADAINTQSGTTYTIVAGDNGKTLVFTNAASVTVTLPTGLGAGFVCAVIQAGTGQVTISPSSTTLNNRSGHTKTAGQHAAMRLHATAANVFNLAGDTGA